MFEAVKMAPPDAILGVTEAFLADPNPHKINLGVGVYKDEEGQTPIMKAVKEAEQRILSTEKSKSYKPIAGDAQYGEVVRNMLFGPGHELAVTVGGRVRTAQTLGCTGALRVAGDYIRHNHPETIVWLPDPTWANHSAVFAAAGIETRTFGYYNPVAFRLDFGKLMESLKKVRGGDVVLLHGCCHNPTGVDPSTEQWTQIAGLLAERGALPLFDLAYQGFADGLERDVAGLREVTAACRELFVCSSNSKNFSLYNERVGALTVVAGSKDAAAAVGSRVALAIRRNYSNPPGHGAAIVSTILRDSILRTVWEAQLAGMRDRIDKMRRLFANTLEAHGVYLGPDGNDFLRRQRGMFSFSGLTKAQVLELCQKHAVYILGSGRINVAGMTSGNMDRLCSAIAAVVAG